MRARLAREGVDAVHPNYRVIFFAGKPRSHMTYFSPNLLIGYAPAIVVRLEAP
jgi:hypothetical protein